ncbi:PREDICTED: developmental pluripotency-associated 5 protein [Mandrillus leucophaeus]|uniref:developmental pluripotency-associated 5 protein n=1 Tax=Mandrillus leucophaeus TaxID=9568 RepID=UPI0005F36E96|nr:PREDICTED: developmental pluripotency-associated 5 protein [Mandrillus leucophaeus]
MGTLPARRNIPPWVKVPEDLKDPEVFQVQTRLLRAMFGPDGSRIPYIEQVSKAMLELKALESSDLTEVVVYGSYLIQKKIYCIGRLDEKLTREDGLPFIPFDIESLVMPTYLKMDCYGKF